MKGLTEKAVGKKMKNYNQERSGELISSGRKKLDEEREPCTVTSTEKAEGNNRKIYIEQ